MNKERYIGEPVYEKTDLNDLQRENLKLFKENTIVKDKLTIIFEYRDFLDYAYDSLEVLNKLCFKIDELRDFIKNEATGNRGSVDANTVRRGEK